jgi:ABC-type multidrug transport system fused ATPase/permease subunit
MKALTFIAEIFRKFPLLFIINTGLLILVNSFGACSLLTIAPVVDLFIHPDFQGVSPLTQKAIGLLNLLGLPVTLGSWLFIFVLFTGLSSGFNLLAWYSILRTKFAMSRKILMGSFEDFFNAEWRFFSTTKQGVLLNTFTRELEKVNNAFSAMGLFFTSIVQIIFYLAIPFYLSWQVTAISLGSGLLFALPFIWLGKFSYRLGKLTTATSNRLISVIHDNFSLTKLILGFGNQYRCLHNLGTAFDTNRRARVKSEFVNISVPILYRPFGVVMIVVALFSARWFGVPLSEITVILAALLQVAICIGKLTMQKNALDNFSPSYEQIEHLRQQAKQLKQPSGTRQFTGFNNKLTMEKVSFAYPGQEPVLVDINLFIPKGSLVAFVGKSGVGKSTLIDIIMGFCQPTKGRVMLDNIPLQEFDIHSYRRRIGYVPQDAVLFNMSIRDNLLWANESATEKEIREACCQANADEFIRRFPEGYDTLVGDRGILLSGGQIQRIALARAILRKPELLILDEATSSLDSHSEYLIQQAIEDIVKETTVVVIAHRLSTIANADYIYVLKDGHIIEEGSYSDLIQKNGYFNRMVEAQKLETVDTA